MGFIRFEVIRKNTVKVNFNYIDKFEKVFNDKIIGLTRYSNEDGTLSHHNYVVKKDTFPIKGRYEIYIKE